MQLYSKWQWAAIGLITLTGCIWSVPYTATSVNRAVGTMESLDEIDVSEVIETRPEFYTSSSYYAGLRSAASVKPERNVRAVLVPHHLLASDLIAEGIKRASGRDISTVVIIGPNHDELGPSVMTTAAAWETPFGYVAGNQRLVDDLHANLLASPNTEGFRAEHSIGAIIPFVNYYLPNADVLPLMLRYDTGDEVKAIAQWLNQNLPDDSLVIYSVDFSHYLTEEEASLNDSVTQRLMTLGKMDQILELDSDYTDSPATLALALCLADLDETGMSIERHANSNDYELQPSGMTTSYHEIVWR